MLVCEIPNIAMNSRSTRVWARLPNLPHSNWKRSLRTKRRPTKVQERFRSKWRMARRSSIQIMPVQYWALFSTQSTMIWTWVTWWGGQAAECPCYSPIHRWQCSRPQVFNSRPAWSKVSGAPGLGNLVHREEMGVGYWYARSTGGGWNGSWKDFHPGCCSNDLQTADWESRNGFATVHFMGEYPCRVGDFGGQWLSRHCRWTTGVVSAPEIEFCAPPPVGDPDNTASRTSSTYIGPWTNLGGHNARGCRDVQDCHRRNDTGNPIQTRQHVALQEYESHLRGSEYQYLPAGKPMQYPPCVIWYLNIQSETIKQWPTLTLFLEFWDFWWVSSMQDKK